MKFVASARVLVCAVLASLLPGAAGGMPSAGSGALLESPPSQRYGHTAIYDIARDRMVLFGGWDGAPRNDLWALPLNGSPVWTNLASGGGPPSPRYSHASIYDPVRDQMVMFGGSGGGWLDAIDTWTLSMPATPTWVNLPIPPGACCPAVGMPSERNWPAAIFDPARNRAVIFGGSDQAGYLGDVWALSLSGTPAWSQITPTGSAPQARYVPSAVYDSARERLVGFGGYRSGTYLRDVWVLSLSGTPTWSTLTPTGGPDARYGHAAIYDPVRDRVVVFAGNSGTDRNDTWALSLSGTPTWTRLTPAGAAPSARFMPTAIYDPLRDRMVVFGGKQGDGFLNDTWALSLAGTPTWTNLSGPDFRFDSLQVVQPVVSSRLVRGKSTVVRAYFHNMGATLATEALVQGELHVLDASGTPVIPPLAAAAPVRWPAGSGQLDETAVRAGTQTLNFYLPLSVTERDQLRFWVAVDPGNLIAETDESNNSNESAPVPQSFHLSKTLRIAYCTVSRNAAPADRRDLGSAADLVFKVYPVARTDDGWYHYGHVIWKPPTKSGKLWDGAAAAVLKMNLWLLNRDRRKQGLPEFDRMVGFFEDWKYEHVPGKTFFGDPVCLLDASAGNKEHALAHELGHTFRMQGEYYEYDEAQQLWVANDGDLWKQSDCPAGAFPCRNFPACSRSQGVMSGRFVDTRGFDVDRTRPAGWVDPARGSYSDAPAPKGVQWHPDFFFPDRIVSFTSLEDVPWSSDRRIGFMGNMKLGAGSAWITNDDYELLADQLVIGSGPASAPLADRLAAPADSEQVWITATIASDGRVHSEEPWEIQSGPFPDALQGTGYSVDMRDQDGGLLESHAFGLEFGDPDTTVFSARLRLPPGTRAVEIRRAGSLLYTRPVSDQAPVVTLTAPDGGALAGPVAVTWRAVDADGDSLVASLDYSLNDGLDWRPLVHGIRDSTFTWQTDSIPGTSSGMLRVRVSDGANTAEDTGGAALVIGFKPPVVAIIAPVEGDTLVAGAAVALHGSMYDPEAGYSLGAGLAWSSSSVGALGAGEHVETTALDAGAQRIRLAGVDGDGNVARDSIQVVVLADSDHDGMPDPWESSYAGLLPNVDDSRLDLDADSLSNRDEYGLGTDPTRLDTDGDGFSDWIEVQMGSDPRTASSTPVTVEPPAVATHGRLTVLSYPNPFRTRTLLRFTLPVAGKVDLTLFDAQGRRTRRFAHGVFAAGDHGVSWDGRDGEGRPVSPGVYFLRIQQENTQAVFRIARVQ